MLLQIARFEITYSLRRPETYLYFICLFLFALVAVDFVFQGELGQMNSNAPYAVAFTMSAVTALFMLLVSIITGTAALRDFENNTAELFFVHPLSKEEYLGGRFLGSFAVLLIIFAGLPSGMVLSEWMPWRDPEKMGAFRPASYLLPFILQVIPSLFFGGALFFVSAALSRKLVVVYTQGIALFVVYLLGVVLTQETNNKLLASLLDPFSFRTSKLITEFWSVEEINNLLLPADGLLLCNRFFWLTLGVLTLLAGCWRFRTDAKVPARVIGKNKVYSTSGLPDHPLFDTVAEPAALQLQPASGLLAGWTKLWSGAFFYFRSIVSERAFLGIILSGAVIILINSVSLGIAYGVDSLPLTYLIVEDLQETSVYFFLILLVFYTGQLMWRERELKAALVFDALPVNALISLGSKFLGLMLVFLLLLFSLVATGILFQLSKGFFQFDPKVYAAGFFLEMLTFLGVYTCLGLFLQALINHKYLAHVVLLLCFIGFQYLEVMGFDHGLYKFGGPGLAKYSAMNGYGDSLTGYAWFNAYWGLFAALLLLAGGLLATRGMNTSILYRIRDLRRRLIMPVRILAFFLLLFFALTGGYIFYNTNILNTYLSPGEEEAYRANYEMELKSFEYLPQPRITAIDLEVELYPEEKANTISGSFTLTNKTQEPVREIHLQKTLDDKITITELSMEGGITVDSSFHQYGYYLLHPTKPLAPGESAVLVFRLTYRPARFTQSLDTRMVANGTFLTNDHLPTLGYNKKYELTDPDIRAEFGLSPRIKVASQSNALELTNNRSGSDADLIDFSARIGTTADQTAVAPGSLVKSWSEGNRNYFHYATEKPIINFFALVSGRYGLLESEWKQKPDPTEKPVTLSIYHHPAHTYNLDRMMRSMKASLDYYTEAFGPYQYDHLRITEFPRYAEFAQSFPGVIPFSEGIGFVMDIDDATEVDMAFFITAHEVAHQWWGMQLQAANVEGRDFILESLAQYSALMVLRRAYPEHKVQQFLRREAEIYFRGRIGADAAEQPLQLVDGREYLHYSKGALTLFTLQAFISESSVNRALASFLADWRNGGPCQTDRYATSTDLLGYFQRETPDSLRYLITDLFGTVTLYDDEIVSASHRPLKNGRYSLGLEIRLQQINVEDGKELPVKGLFRWLPIAVYDLNGEVIYDQMHYLQPGKQTLTIMVAEEPSRAVIDPQGLYPDRRPGNNRGVVHRVNTDD